MGVLQGGCHPLLVRKLLVHCGKPRGEGRSWPASSLRLRGAGCTPIHKAPPHSSFPPSQSLSAHLSCLLGIPPTGQLLLTLSPSLRGLWQPRPSNMGEASWGAGPMRPPHHQATLTCVLRGVGPWSDVHVHLRGRAPGPGHPRNCLLPQGPPSDPLSSLHLGKLSPMTTPIIPKDLANYSSLKGLLGPLLPVQTYAPPPTVHPGTFLSLNSLPLSLLLAIQNLFFLSIN